MKKIYTNEQKEKILKMYWSGEPVTSISASTGVAQSTLYKWIREAPSKKGKQVNMTDFRILKQRCETLEQMVEILQMSHKFGGILEIAVRLQKIRNGAKSRFLYRLLKTNNTPIELLWFRFGVLFILRCVDKKDAVIFCNNICHQCKQNPLVRFQNYIWESI